MLLEVEPEIDDYSSEKQALKDKHNEQELSKLQRAFRQKANGVPTTYLKEKKWLQRDISCYLKEKTELDTILKHVLCKQHVQTYEDQIQFLQNHLDCQKILDEEIKTNQIYVDQINSQLRRLDDLELDMKRESLTDFQRQEKMRKAKKDYDVYNQRLYVSKQKEGVFIKENYELQTIIRQMLFEREIFNKNWNSLVNELGHNRRYLIDLIERSILAFTRDEDYFARIDVLEQRAQNTKNLHISEILQLFRKLDADQIYQDYLGVKGFRRELMSLDEREVRRRDTVEKDLKAKLHLFWKIINKVKDRYGPKPEPMKKEKGEEKKEKKEANDKEKEQEFVEKAQSIIDDSPHKEIERKLLLLWTIIDQHKIHDKNYFAHFKYLNDVYNTIEILNGQIVNKHKQISYHREIQKTNKKDYAANHRNIYNTLKQLQQETTKKEKAWKLSESQLNKYLSSIHLMFQTLKCDSSFIESLLGDKMTVTNFNIKLFLSTLETTLNKILSYIYFSEVKAKIPPNRRTIKTKRVQTHIISAHNTVNTTQCSECAEREDVNRYDETVVLPSNKPTVKERVKQRVLTNELEYRLHNLSKCRLPKSRILVNKRYM